jgi:hypothetical protein
MSGTMQTSETAATEVASVRDRRIARFAWWTAWFGLVLGQLHALARYRTDDGKEDLDLPLTAAWAKPADRVLSPLLDWASPDAVYATYGKLWLVVFVGFTAMAFVAFRHRHPSGWEKWAWRIALFAYVGACVSVVAEYWTQWGSQTNDLLDIVFLATLPLVLLTMLGSSVLGVTLLIKRFRPGTAAVLLALTLPGAFVISAVTSMGNIVLPIAFAMALIGRRLTTEPR